MIYNAPSIYKQGGGGGGYKDGGALVDGNFIKVENNTLSSYDNTTRSDVNFYFEVGDGEVINSVVELTTTVNATIHVYILNNGIYTPIGNIGGNTVNSGENYNINIVGDSFIIEQVLEPNEPQLADIGGDSYEIKKIGNLIWMLSNYHGYCNSNFKSVGSCTYYEVTNNLMNFNFGNGWRLPEQDDFTNLINSVNGESNDLKAVNTSYSTWDSRATNLSGLSIFPYGSFNNPNNNVDVLGIQARLVMKPMVSDSTEKLFILGQGNNEYYIGSQLNTINWIPIRLCKNV